MMICDVKECEGAALWVAYAAYDMAKARTPYYSGTPRR
jgi:hypothetical protein